MRALSRKDHELIRLSIERAIPTEPVAVDRSGILLQPGDRVRVNGNYKLVITGLRPTRKDGVRLEGGYFAEDYECEFLESGPGLFHVAR